MVQIMFRMADGFIFSGIKPWNILWGRRDVQGSKHLKGSRAQVAILGPSGWSKSALNDWDNTSQWPDDDG